MAALAKAHTAIDRDGDNWHLQQDILMLLYQLAQSPLHHPYIPGSITFEDEVEVEGVSEAEKAADERDLQKWLNNYLEDYDTESDEEQEKGSEESEGEESVDREADSMGSAEEQQAEASTGHSSDTKANRVEASHVDRWKPITTVALPRPTEESGDRLICKVSAWEGN